MGRATDWTAVPLLLCVNDLRDLFALSRQQAYAVANKLGVRLGKRIMVPRARLQEYLEEGPAGHSSRRERR